MTTVNGVVQGNPPAGVAHLKIPFALADDGTAETLAQGTSAEIVQCVANLVGTRPGTRLLVPTYGMLDPTFAGVNRLTLTAAVAKFEPRASVTVVLTPAGTEQVIVDVVGGTP